MEYLLYILSGLLIALTGAAGGSYVGGKHKVSDNLCQERRAGCEKNNTICFEHIKNDLEEIKQAIKKLPEKV